MLNKLEYVDMVIDETLRLYPPILRIDRVCNEDYTYKDKFIPKGCLWNLCIWALHHDEKNYPDPVRFDPERFSPDRKKSRNIYAFMPFGIGPRNCIGNYLIYFKKFVIKILSF